MDSQSTLHTPSTFEPYGFERRQRFSAFLAVLETRSGDTSRGTWREETLGTAIRCLAPVQAARLTTASLTSRTREDPPSPPLRFALGPGGPSGLSLEVYVESAHRPDEWDRRMFQDAARVLGLVLGARGRMSPVVVRRLDDPAAPIIGSSEPMRRLLQQIERVDSTDFTLLIDGETGSGKELVARQVHCLSRRHQGPFVAVNCAALVDTLLEAELFGIEDRVATGVRGRRGKFEMADQGTLFLDEVGDLSPSA